MSSKWAFPDFFAPQKLIYHPGAKFPSRARGSPGVMGDTTVASRESGEKFLSAIINDPVEILVEIAVRRNHRLGSMQINLKGGRR